MSAVDVVAIFDEPTPLDLVLAIRPDVMVKGNDYTKAAIAGAAEIESWGRTSCDADAHRRSE
jgi:D-beta-D-heptose 7-phosphate kinase/D-beta-D-heptose 1-phosphate adenosyltransferase